MNDWKTDSELYEDVLDPNAKAAKEIEKLREEIAALMREILALKKELADSRKEKEAWEKEFGGYLTKRYDSRQRALDEESEKFIKELYRASEKRKKEADKEHANLIKLVAGSGKLGHFEYMARVYVAIASLLKKPH